MYLNYYSGDLSIKPRRVQCKYSRKKATFVFYDSVFSDYLLTIYADDWRFANKITQLNTKKKKMCKNFAFTTQTLVFRRNMCEIIRHISC